jgi:hypothetical protein
MNDALRGARDLVGEYREFVGQARDATRPGLGNRRAAPPGVSKALVREHNREMVKAFMKDFRKPGAWEIDIPGEHYSGLSNNALMEVRQNEGRDFIHHSVQLDQHVQKELGARWNGFDARAVTVDELREDAEKIVRIYVVSRIMHAGLDVECPPLTPRYAEAKRKAGFGGRPIGVRRGRHLAAIQSKLTLRWKS